MDLGYIRFTTPEADLRQGVGETAHALLDRIDTLRAKAIEAHRDWGATAHLETARALAERAARSTLPVVRREMAIESAAHAFIAAEMLDRAPRPVG